MAGGTPVILTLDFETYFDSDYTLSKMTTEAYIRDPRFEAHGAAIKIDNQPAVWAEGSDVPVLLGGLVARADGVLCHHAHFDGLILSHAYGLKPRFWFDTLSMARALIGNHLSASLDSLAKHFNLGTKDVPYNLFRGRHWHEIDHLAQGAIAIGSCGDADLTYDLFLTLAKAFPASEYPLVDATVRMFTEPEIEGDIELLSQMWSEEQAARAELLAELGVTLQDLGSSDRFAELLRAEGVEPDTKPGKNHDNYAFAKNDRFMRELLEHDDERVALLAEARLASKSNLVGSRCERLGWMATRGPMCVYEAYCAAHTKRWGGGDKTNYQNFPRPKEIPEGLKPTERQIVAMRRAGMMQKTQRAPKGKVFVIRDASQIECRLLNAVAGQWDKVQEFRDGKDPYVGVASAFFGYAVNKKDHPEQRQAGKVVELQSGYGSGGGKIAHTLRTFGMACTDDEGTGWRDAYRGTHTQVVNLWGQAGDVLKFLHAGQDVTWGPVQVSQQRIWLPNGLPLIFTELDWFTAEDGDSYWRLRTRDGYTKMYGAKLVENLIQALARVKVGEAWLDCIGAGMKIVSMEHDKLIALVDERDAAAADAFMDEALKRAPVWLPDIPLDSEGYISDTFAKPEN